MNEKKPHWHARMATKEEEEDIIKDFSDIGNFTITITNSEDLLFLHSASLMHICNGNSNLAKGLLLLMANGAHDIGAEKAVDMSINEGRERGYYFPDFFKPLSIAMLNHSMAKAKEKQKPDKE